MTEEATASITNRKILETADWRFHPDDGKPAKIVFELDVKIENQVGPVLQF